MVFYHNSGYNGNMRNEEFDVGARIVQLRQKKNITTNKLANMAGVSLRTIRFYDSKGLLKPVFYSEAFFCFFIPSDHSERKAPFKIRTPPQDVKPSRYRKRAALLRDITL